MSATLDAEPATDEEPVAPHREAPADSLAESVVLMLVLLVAQRLIGFVRGTIVCRELADYPAELGHWDLALGVLTMVAPLAVFGLPGSFGRFVGYYRQQGHLSTFLRQTTAAAGLLTVATIVAMVVRPDWTSWLFFKHADETALVLAMAAGLGGLVAFNFLNDLFTGLRRFRLVSVLQLVHATAFAVLSVALIVSRGPTAFWLAVAYGGSCLLGVAVALCFLRSVWPNLPVAREPLRAGDLWRRLLPFAAWLWVTNVVMNLFMLLDRELIAHFSGLPKQRALELIGNYHSARLMPLLLASIGTTLAGVVMPHLSHDWEAGRRREVSDRINLALKLVGLLLTAGGTAILVAAPLLFGVAFQGKYAAGEAVLPWTLTYCVWLGMTGLAQNYLWCAEKVGLGCLALFAGLALNVGLNLTLVPLYGLQGAVWATAAATLLALTLTYLFAYPLGLRPDARVWLAMLLPLSLAGGKWTALTAVATVLLLGAGTNWLLDADEKQKLRGATQGYARRLGLLRQR